MKIKCVQCYTTTQIECMSVSLSLTVAVFHLDQYFTARCDWLAIVQVSEYAVWDGTPPLFLWFFCGTLSIISEVQCARSREKHM